MTEYKHDTCKNCGNNDFESVGYTFADLADFERVVLRCTACDTYHKIQKLTGALSKYDGEIFPFSGKTAKD